MEISEKDKRIKKELNRLKRIFKNIDEDRKNTAKSLIENAAFLSVTLSDLQQSINDNGTMMEYKNGEHQYGTRQSPDISTYNAFIQRYTTIIQTLINLLPKDETTAFNLENTLNDFKKPQ